MSTSITAPQAKADWLIETYTIEELRVVWKWYNTKIRANEPINAGMPETRAMFHLITQVGWAMAHPLSVAREEVKAAVDHEALARFNRPRASLRG